MPTPLVEEIEDALEGLVGYVNILIRLLDGMFGEHAAIEIGDAAIGLLEIGRALRNRLVESILEEVLKERAIEGVELVFAARLLHPHKLVAEVVLVVVEKTLLLDEVAKHEPIEHDRSIPLSILLHRDVLYSLNKLLVLLAESLIELLRDLGSVDEKRLVDAIHDVDNRRGIVERERDGVKLFKEKRRLIILSVFDYDELTLIDGLDGNRPQMVKLLGHGDEHHQIGFVEPPDFRIESATDGGIGNF